MRSSLLSIRSRSVLTVIGLITMIGTTGKSAWGLPAASETNVTAAMRQLEQDLAPVQARVAELRGTLIEDSILSTVRAATIASEHPLALRGLELDAPAPATLEQAVAEISSGVARADRITRGSAAAKLATRYTIQEVLDLSFALLQNPEHAPAVPTPTPVPALRAAAIIASAVDRSLPALNAAAAQSRAPDTDTAPGCDLVDQSPTLCVGGIGNNQYDGNELVLIDLGGDDLYTNNAGAASLGAALTLDLAGNDTYDANKYNQVAQGTGFFGAVGMLVDGAGNDTYRITSTLGATSGQGLGFLGGAGFLLDGTGNDKYLQSSSAVGVNAGAAGQGEGFFAGVAAFVDGGLGDDVYSLYSLAIPKEDVVQDDDGKVTVVTRLGTSAAAAQAVGGFAGSALFSDGGGKDSFSMHVHTEPVPPDAPPILETLDEVAGTWSPFIQVAGQGDAIIGGNAFFLEGPGDTTYSMVAEAAPMPIKDNHYTGSVVGQGSGPGATYGVLSDPSGNDTYVAKVSIASHVSLTARDGCACKSPLASIGTVQATVQGNGQLGGAGVLDDGAGNDTFSVEISNSVTLSVDDQRTTPANPLRGTAEADPATTWVQGAGNQAGGLGVLSSSAGDDTYSVKATSSAVVNGTSSLPENDPDLLASPGAIGIDAQGVGTNTGTGALMDTGGKDSYTTIGSASSTVDGGAPTAGLATMHVQGAADAAGGAAQLGLLVDLDGNSLDSFSQTPAYPACQGSTRGQGLWQDCGSYGFGLNA